MFEIVLIIGLFWLFFAIAVAENAKKSGMNDRPWFWIVLVFGIFGVAAYAISLSSQPTNQSTLRIEGDVIERSSGKKSTKALEVTAPSIRAAESRFVKECSGEDYKVISNSIKIQEIGRKDRGSKIQEDDDTPTAKEERFRPGKDLLPDGRIKNWYETTHWVVLTFLSILVIIPILTLPIFPGLVVAIGLILPYFVYRGMLLVDKVLSP